MLLTIFPVIAASALYWLIVEEVFDTQHEEPPSSWAIRLVLPILTGTLATLSALGGKHRIHHEAWHLSVVAVGVLFSVVALAALSRDNAFYDLQLPLRIGGRRFRAMSWWQAARAVGLLILLYGLIVTLAIGG